MLKLTDHHYRLAARVLLLCVGIVILLTFRDYGITWDEELQSQYGLAVVDYYVSFFQDHRYADIFNLHLYGGMFDGLASVIDRYTPFSLYETRHLVNAFFGLAGLWGTWRLGRLIGGSVVGLMALVMLILTPMYYGHMFNNPKDIPFAAGIIWSMYYMGRCFQTAPAVPRHVIVKLGIILGLTLGVRVGGVMLPAFFFMILGIDALRDFPKLSASKIKIYLFHIALPVGVITYIVMLICWPWAQQNPILNPLRALSEFSNFPQDVEVLLDGTNYRSTQLPWYYVPLYFSVQLPEFLLALLAASLVTLPFVLKTLDKVRQQLLSLMLLMGLLPILYAMLHHPALYDAVRHFLFATSLASIVAALTLRQIYLSLRALFNGQSVQRVIAIGTAVVVVATITMQMSIMRQLHPYEYIFINQFAGGVAGAFGRYELDYWGSSFKEAAHDLQNYVAKEGGVPAGKIYKIAICGPWSAAMIYLPPDYEPVIANEPAEFFLSTTRWLCPNMRPGKEIIKIDRMGAPLAVIKDLRGGFEHYEGNAHK